MQAARRLLRQSRPGAWLLVLVVVAAVTTTADGQAAAVPLQLRACPEGVPPPGAVGPNVSTRDVSCATWGRASGLGATAAECAGYGFRCVDVVAMADAQSCNTTWATLDAASRRAKLREGGGAFATELVCGACQAVAGTAGAAPAYYRVDCTSGGVAGAQTLSVRVTPRCDDGSCTRCTGVAAVTSLRDVGATAPAACASLWPGSGYVFTPIGFASECSAARLQAVPVGAANASCPLAANASAAAGGAAVTLVPSATCVAIPTVAGTTVAAFVATCDGDGGSPPAPEEGPRSDRRGASSLVVIVGLVVVALCITVGVLAVAKTRSREAALRRRDAFLAAHMNDADREEELRAVSDGDADADSDTNDDRGERRDGTVLDDDAAPLHPRSGDGFAATKV